MSETTICTVCGGYIGNTTLFVTLTTTSTSPIVFCPGHAITDVDTAGHFPVMCTGVGPELIHIPKDAQIYPNNYLQQQNELWEIVQEVAEENYKETGLLCPFCEQQFIHSLDCIVTKARALMEWHKAQPQIKAKIEKPMVSEKEIDKIVERLSRSGYNVSITQDGRSILIRVSKMVDGTVYISERYVAGEGLTYIRKRLLLEMCEEKMETLRQSIATGW